MKIGGLTRIAVPGTDLVMLVRVKWGEYKRLTQAVAGQSEVEALPAIDEFLTTVISDLRGLEDEAGQPLPWSPEVLNDLPPGTIISMFQALMQIGEAGSGDPLPVTVSPEAFAAPPAASPQVSP